VTVAAVLDACVLYPIGLRDVLLDLASELGLFRPRWSATILDEMERNLVSDGRCSPAQAADLRSALEAVFPEAEVTGYEELVSQMTNHPKDRHVLAAAVASDAEIIVTSNLKDFPATACDPVGVRVLSPDTFLTRCHQLHAGVDDVVRGVAARYGRKGRAVSFEDMVSRLFLTAPNFAAALIEQAHQRGTTGQTT